jgi:hypothetical protein
VHDHLAQLIKRVRSKIYGAGSKTRRTAQAKKVEKNIIGVAGREIAKVAPEAAQKMKAAWENATKDDIGEKRLLRKFTVDELYEIVVEVAEEILSPSQLDKFLDRLTERLRK